MTDDAKQFDAESKLNDLLDWHERHEIDTEDLVKEWLNVRHVSIDRENVGITVFQPVPSRWLDDDEILAFCQWCEERGGQR